MKIPQTFLVCVCLLGATQLASSQVKSPTASAIPGYLDPKTGRFTTQTGAATVQPNAQGEAALTGTNLFFREDFQIQIQNYDQPANATAVCSVDIGTSDTNSFSDSASVPAIATGSGWSCDVPILTLWTLKTPTSDTIYASVGITIYPQGFTAPIYRTSYQSFSLAVPTNGQTVITSAIFQL